jgi:hypothetical protein
LAGVLFLERPADCGRVLLDGTGIPAEGADQGIPVRPGEHTLACVAADGKAARPERTSLLPFQRKIVRLRPPGTEG